MLASETCALDIVGAKFVREIENGEIVIISEKGVESIKPFPPRAASPCASLNMFTLRDQTALCRAAAFMMCAAAWDMC